MNYILLEIRKNEYLPIECCYDKDINKYSNNLFIPKIKIIKYSL